MKRFTFSLQKVLEYNSHVQKNEADLLCLLENEYRLLIQKRDHMMREYEINQQKYQLDCKHGLNVRKAYAAGQYVKEQSQQILKVDQQIQEQLQKIDKQRNVLIAVTQDVKMIEKLKEHSWDEYVAVGQKAEELFIEEFITNKSVSARLAGA